MNCIALAVTLRSREYIVLRTLSNQKTIHFTSVTKKMEYLIPKHSKLYIYIWLMTNMKVVHTIRCMHYQIKSYFHSPLSIQNGNMTSIFRLKVYRIRMHQKYMHCTQYCQTHVRGDMACKASPFKNAKLFTQRSPLYY